MLNRQDSWHVAVRCRPLTPIEILKSGSQSTIEIDHLNKQLTITNPTADIDKYSPRSFKFSALLDDSTSQEQVYKETIFPVVEDFLSGYDSAIIVYGQTGTGKTYTMEGVPDSEEYKGIIPRAFDHIFKHLESSQGKYHSVHVSNIMIYNEKIRDLLAETPSNSLEIRESKERGVYIRGLTTVSVESLSEIYKQFQLGIKNKKLASNHQNKDCCRSHSIFSITIESCEIGPDGFQNTISRKLELADMAGSERSKRIHGEFVGISISIPAFGNVICKLADPKAKHVPYRDSKFTRLMQNALGGNGVTAFLGHISPAIEDYDETLSTLRCCMRAQMIKKKLNKESKCKSTTLNGFIDEIETLKYQLQEISNGKLQANPSFEEMKEFFIRTHYNQKESDENKET